MPQMRSRREQVDAHKFITSRMNQALVLANPDSIERPLRRIGLSIFVSVMVLALVFGGFAVATLFGKGNDLPQLNHIIQVKGTSALYVYTTADGKDPSEGNEAKLWPVTNFTSALLLLQPYQGDPPVQSLKATSLKDIPRGFMVGLTDVPAQPPTKEELLQDQDWNACSMPREVGSTDAFQLTQLVIEDMAEPTSWLGEEQWVLAKVAEDAEAGEERYYLLWNDRKYRIDDLSVLNSLGLNENQAVPVNANVMTTIKDGAPVQVDIEQYFTSTSTEDVKTESGATVVYGQPLEIAGAFYVLLQTADNGDEFAPITEVQMELLQSEYGEPVTVTPQVRDEIGAQATYGSDIFLTDVLKDAVWNPEGERPALCAVYDPQAQEEGNTKIEIALYDSAPQTLTSAAESVEFTPDGDIHSSVDNLAAQTVLAPGRAVLADARTDEGATVQGNTYLIDSLGFQYGIVDEGQTDSTQNLLGYQGVAAVSVPDTMLSLVPPGTDLDPWEARKQLTIDDSEATRYDTGEETAQEGG
ncbi:type VII secretion protein EccB [Glycomyces terrestris]|uniref:Type VII secretion protein EccB n=1 Tax=Glycomyces terrestris TaxID=2493553 RepID=A0A426UWT4_9ACTN|nr:type VII secretion protein EccB [Glycomyces terrestris]RRR99093.1 type VII secretion protein EccB [Glycomyces terrestris]